MTVRVCDWIRHRMGEVISSPMVSMISSPRAKKWRTRKKCGIGYEANAWDLKVAGCGRVNEITEEDIEFDGLTYSWQCNHCDIWHPISENLIPQDVKERIKKRHLKH